MTILYYIVGGFFCMKKHIFMTMIGLGVILFVLLRPIKDELPYYEVQPNIIDVTITGAVQKPGTYQVEQGMSLAYLVHLAGGLLNDANIEHLRLGDVMIENDYHIPFYDVQVTPIITRIDLNKATYETLIKVPNITENRALEILLYKKEHGQFKSIEELLNVKGIGAATFEKIKLYFFI